MANWDKRFWDLSYFNVSFPVQGQLDYQGQSFLLIARENPHQRLAYLWSSPSVSACWHFYDYKCGLHRRSYPMILQHTYWITIPILSHTTEKNNNMILHLPWWIYLTLSSTQVSLLCRVFWILPTIYSAVLVLV